VVSFSLHWIGWILIYFLTYVPTLISVGKVNWNFLLFNYVLFPSIYFILFYLVAFILLPLIGIKQRRWVWLVLICLVLAFAFSYLRFRIDNALREQNMREMQSRMAGKGMPMKIIKQPVGVFSYLFGSYLRVNAFTTLSIIFIAFAYRLLLTWYMQEKIRKDLENQKLQAELSYLKMQVNPHFLFNALNNIYSLAVSEKGKKTGDSIMKLSELLRYVLYEKEDEQHKVSLEKEIKHINSYIDLMKLRYEGDVYINFSIEGNIDGKRIAPLLLFPLIENAAKHGILTDSQKPVDIELKVAHDSIVFSIRNFKNSYLKDMEGGIGIQNVQKRLELLYENSYSLNVKETADKFFVDLQLPLPN
jgi:hypothetical protein